MARRIADRKCNTCGQAKPLTEFYDAPAGIFLKKANCKSCYNEKQKQHRSEGKGREISRRHRERKRGYTTEEKYSLETDEKRRICRKCRETKPLEDFAPNKSCKFGRTHTCRKCCSAHQLIVGKESRQRYADRNSEKIRAWHREYSKTEQFKKSRKKYYATERCKELSRERVRRYKEKHPDRVRKQNRERRRREYRDNPEKVKARLAISYAIRVGKLVRPDKCSLDNEQCRGKIQSHHDDYSKKLEVTWLCSFHHHKLHLHLEEEGAEPRSSTPSC